MTTAVVPVAFFTEQHVEMTAAMLDQMQDEGVEPLILHNGGPLRREGWRMLTRPNVRVVGAERWSFYEMWNYAFRLLDPVVVVMNNDIEWDKWALHTLSEKLLTSPDDVAIVSPSPNGEPRHCFAIRPDMAPHIDERYQTWYGDVELEYLVKQAGHRLVHYDPGIRHPHIQTTTDHVPGIHDMRLADQKLFDSKWHTD